MESKKNFPNILAIVGSNSAPHSTLVAETGFVRGGISSFAVSGLFGDSNLEQPLKNILIHSIFCNNRKRLLTVAVQKILVFLYLQKWETHISKIGTVLLIF